MEFVDNLARLFSVLWDMVLQLTPILSAILPWALWLAWWLFAVNWRKAWPMLAEGGWVPVFLLMIVASFAWATIDSRAFNCLGFTTVSNGWWQFGYVCTLSALALLCGWLQDYFAWTPPEIGVEPPPVSHEHYVVHTHH